MPLSLLDRKAELVRRGVRVQAVANELGVTYQHVRAVLVGERRSPRVEEALAAAMEMPADEVFPPMPHATAAAA